MMKAILLAAILSISCVTGSPFSEDWKPPKFCNRLECPRFKTLTSNKNYEARGYEESAWVFTTEAGIDYKEASGKMFPRLFQYISGENVPKQKVAMTAPVIVKVEAGQGPACESNFTMGFFIPPEHATNPPKPTNAAVFIGSLPAQTVYLNSFGGYAGIQDYLKAGTRLTTDLPSSATYDKSYFFTVGYDSPFKPFFRHNEIWFIGK